MVKVPHFGNIWYPYFHYHNCSIHQNRLSWLRTSTANVGPQRVELGSAVCVRLKQWFLNYFASLPSNRGEYCCAPPPPWLTHTEILLYISSLFNCCCRGTTKKNQTSSQCNLLSSPPVGGATPTLVNSVLEPK